ncbi:MAG: metal ABC transporter ATP-binding protein [Firmicutes bacterium]|nr:metal ABC transporter ATP-binding protein [Bacillota bacterium]
MDSSMIIVIRDLTAGYRSAPVLKKLNLAVKQGESVGIAGPNGAGKTTLLKVILGMIPKTQGEIRILGRVLKSMQDRAWVRRRIGYVPQQTIPGKLPVSVFDAVLMGRWGKSFGFARRPDSGDREAVKAKLSQVGLGHKAGDDCRRLSGGEQQKVAIARALVREAGILLLDEPATYLDRESRDEITALIQKIRAEQGLTMIVISHDPVHLQAMTDRIYSLDNGNLRTDTNDSD